jgi:hypothetical protein
MWKRNFMFRATEATPLNESVGFLQPLQGRTHQIKQLLTPGQKDYLRSWLARAAPQAWEATDEHFKMLFELE